MILLLASTTLQVFAAAPTAAPSPAATDSAPSDIEQRLRIIERKLENQADDAQAKAKDAPVTSANDKGFGIASADGTYALKIHGLLQFDGRFFLGDPAGLGLIDTFTFRRIEPVFEANVGKLIYFKLQPQFAGDTASTADVYGELRFAPAFVVRGGKYKEPLSLENLAPASAIEFDERGFPTEIAANRDLGLQVQGDLLDATTSYSIGLFNGAPDGRDSVAADTDNRKEGVARLWFEPFKNDYGFFKGFGFGVAGSTGTKLNAPTTTATTAVANFNNTLPRYRSPGQNTVFTYLINTTTPTAANTVVADGKHTRVSPQLYFYAGSFGLLGEYISSQQEVALGGVKQKFTNKAYQGVVNYVITGEDASYKGIKPAKPYTVGGEGWGALDVGLRYGVLDVDDNAFPVFADPTKSVSKERDAGADVNWYPTANVRVSTNFDVTRFTGGAAGTANRPLERALFTRLQFAF